MAKEKMTKEQKTRVRRRIGKQVKGGVFILFAVIGVVAVITSLVELASPYFGKEQDMKEFEELIAPLVAMDPVPFEGAENASRELLTESAIWAVFNNEDTSSYGRTEDDQLLIPVTEINIYFTRMYGKQTDMIDDADFTIADLTYKYDADTDSFILPITGQIGIYTPNVSNTKTSGGTNILTVEYLLASDDGGEEETSEVVKTMEYILMKGEDGWYIYSVRYPEK